MIVVDVKPRHRMIALQYESVDQAHKVFRALSRGGKVTMLLSPAFCADYVQQLTASRHLVAGEPYRPKPMRGRGPAGPVHTWVRSFTRLPICQRDTGQPPQRWRATLRLQGVLISDLRAALSWSKWASNDSLRARLKTQPPTAFKSASTEKTHSFTISATSASLPGFRIVSVS